MSNKIDGLWILKYSEKNIVQGAGVLYVNDGSIYGGDSSAAITGSIQLNGSDVVLDIDLREHTQLPGSELLISTGKHTINGRLINNDLIEASIGQLVITATRYK